MCAVIPEHRIVTVALSLVLILGVVLFEGRPRAAISCLLNN